MHYQHKAMTEEMGDCEHATVVWSSFGNCYYATGEYARALEMHEQCKVSSWGTATG